MANESPITPGAADSSAQLVVSHNTTPAPEKSAVETLSDELRAKIAKRG